MSNETPDPYPPRTLAAALARLDGSQHALAEALGELRRRGNVLLELESAREGYAAALRAPCDPGSRPSMRAFHTAADGAQQRLFRAEAAYRALVAELRATEEACR